MQSVNDGERILRIRAVCERIGCSKSSLYLMLGQGQFPAAIRIGLRSVGWRQRDVDTWLDSRPAVDLRKEPKSNKDDDANLAA